jgi:hypothetical protein
MTLTDLSQEKLSGGCTAAQLHRLRLHFCFENETVITVISAGLYSVKFLLFQKHSLLIVGRIGHCGSKPMASIWFQLFAFNIDLFSLAFNKKQQLSIWHQ